MSNNGSRNKIQEVTAALVSIVLVITVSILAILGKPINDPLEGAMYTVLGFLFGTALTRRVNIP